jgi:hypothetical protein
MKRIAIAALLMCIVSVSHAAGVDRHALYFPTETLYCDSDSMFVNRAAEVIRFDNRLYQMGIQVGTFDKKTSISKGKVTTRIQIYNMQGKTVADCTTSGINASYVVTIYPNQEKFSISPAFDHEVEEIAGKLRVMEKL